MTRFEKDTKTIKTDRVGGMRLLEGRLDELNQLRQQLRSAKDGFRRTSIAQDYDRLKKEYNGLADLLYGD